MHPLLAAASQIPLGAPPGRAWLDSLRLIVPGPAASRWLLAADAVVVVLVARRRGRPLLAAAVGLAVAFVALNVLGMLLLDFFLGLALFHLLTGLAGLAAPPPVRWAGAALLALTLALGVLT